VPVVRALVVLIIACSLWLLAPPASAGGPTSALLSIPGQGRTASLYYTDAEYEELAELVGVSGGAGAVDRSGRSHESGTAVNVTWLIHDVTPWRVDRIYLSGDGAPWVATQQSMGDTGELWDSPVVWTQPTDGEALVALLESLGLGRAAPAGQATDDTIGDAKAPVRPEVDEPVEPVATAPAPADESSETSGPDGVWWGLGGVGLGMLLAAAWKRLRPNRNDDAEPAPAPEPVRPGAVTEWLEPASRT
jgi:hypothetical protein